MWQQARMHVNWGYWLAYPFWGKGYMLEAAEELLRHGFEDLDMKQIWCGYYEAKYEFKTCTRKMWVLLLLHNKRCRSSCIA